MFILLKLRFFSPSPSSKTERNPRRLSTTAYSTYL
jgi:hypothetical protein